MFCFGISLHNRKSKKENGYHGFEMDTASLTAIDEDPSAMPLPLLFNFNVFIVCTVLPDRLEEEGRPPTSPAPGIKELRVWLVAVEMAVAKDIGMRQRPFP